jgi:prevent-host-death family protein
MATVEPHSIGAYQAKSHFSELLDRVENGEEITITKHGNPVAKLVPVRRESTAKERRAAMDRWINAPDRPRLGGLKRRDLIDEGRP